MLRVLRMCGRVTLACPANVYQSDLTSIRACDLFDAWLSEIRKDYGNAPKYINIIGDLTENSNENVESAANDAALAFDALTASAGGSSSTQSSAEESDA